MTLNEQVGLTGPVYRVDIERGKVREFARAMDAPLPEFLEGECPVIPATFLVCAPYTWGYTLERPRGTVFADIEHEVSVSLHAEESFSFLSDLPHAGDKLFAQPSLEKVWQKQGSSGGQLTFLTILNQYRNEQGKLVAEQRSTSVTTEASPEDGNWQVEVPDYLPQYSGPERSSGFAQIRRQEMADLKPDQGPGAIALTPLLKQEIVRFQGVVGEDDPLHHDREWAQQHGYPEVFALGTHQASLMAAYAAYWLPPEAVRSFKVRFVSLAWPGDRLIYAGKVIELDQQHTTARIHLTCQRSNGDMVSQAWMNYRFK